MRRRVNRPHAALAEETFNTIGPFEDSSHQCFGRLVLQDHRGRPLSQAMILVINVGNKS